MLYYNELTERQRELVLLDLRERVAKGVALLDEYEPSWRLEINISALDIDAEDRCILGQVFGDYFEGKDCLGIADDPGSDYGFDVYYFDLPGDTEDLIGVGSDLVRDEWLRHL